MVGHVSCFVFGRLDARRFSAPESHPGNYGDGDGNPFVGMT